MSVACNSKPYISCFFLFFLTQHPAPNILSHCRAQKPLGELKADRGEEKFKNKRELLPDARTQEQPISHFIFPQLSSCLPPTPFLHVFFTFCCLDVKLVSVSRARFGAYLPSVHSCYLSCTDAVCAPYVAQSSHRPPHATL